MKPTQDEQAHDDKAQRHGLRASVEEKVRQEKVRKERMAVQAFYREAKSHPLLIQARRSSRGGVCAPILSRNDAVGLA